MVWVGSAAGPEDLFTVLAREPELVRILSPFVCEYVWDDPWIMRTWACSKTSTQALGQGYARLKSSPGRPSKDRGSHWGKGDLAGKWEGPANSLGKCLQVVVENVSAMVGDDRWQVWTQRASTHLHRCRSLLPLARSIEA